MTRDAGIREMSLHLIQLKVEPGQVDQNLLRAAELLAKVPVRPGDVVLLPEMFPSGFFYRDLGAMADRKDQVLSWMSDWAARHKAFIAGSMPQRRESGIANCLEVVGPQGARAGSYDKVHLFSVAREDRHFVAGRSAEVADLEGVTAGLLICFDLRFPELARILCLRGAQLLLAPSQWPRSRVKHFSLLARARAMENQLFLAAANACGPDASGTVMGGGSLVVGPMGDVLAQGGEGEEVLSASFTAAEVSRVRRDFPVLSMRRPEAYGGSGWAGS